jgi:glucose repression mediator protein
MACQKYNKAYEAYQQAVYRDGRNPTFWCSIGVLYFQINQYRDALDAYSRAIRLNPYIPEVWFDLGSLYESCNNQISDAIDAYTRASELDANNPAITQRLQLLKDAEAAGDRTARVAPPHPQDVHPTAYASSVQAPPGPPLHFNTGPRGANGRPELPPMPAQMNGHGHGRPPSPAYAPPPIVLDEARMNAGRQLAPMDDRPHGFANGREGPPRSAGMLLHHPVPQPQFQEGVRNEHPHGIDAYAGRAPPDRRMYSVSPPPQGRRSPQMYPAHPHHRGSIGPGQNGMPPPLPGYGYDPAHAAEREQWERRKMANEQWEHEQAERRSMRRHAEYAAPPSAGPYSSRGPSPSARQRARRERSPTSPRSPPTRQYWDPKHSGGPMSGPSQPPPSMSRPPPTPPYPEHSAPGRRYDPRMEARAGYDDPRGYGPPSEAVRQMAPPAHPHPSGRSVSPSGSSVHGSRGGRRRAAKEKDEDEPPKKSRKRAPAKRPKEEPSPLFSTQPAAPAPPEAFHSTPGPSSSTDSVEHSARPSPTAAPPVRNIDEDYDEGVAETLMSLHSGASHGALAGPASSPAHRNSVSSTRSRQSPTPQAQKRPLSPSQGEQDRDVKRHRLDPGRRRSSSPGRRTPPAQSSRPSPIPFRTQPASHPVSPEEPRQSAEPRPFDASPQLPQVLPPHPRPLGAGGHAAPMALPPIATLPQTLSPTSTTGSPNIADDREARRSPRAASPPPQSRAPKLANMMNSPSVPASPARKRSQTPATAAANEA